MTIGATEGAAGAWRPGSVRTEPSEEPQAKRARRCATDAGLLEGLPSIQRRTGGEDSRSVEAVRNEAAATITRAMRSMVAARAVTSMMRSGEMWSKASQALSRAGLLAPQEKLTMQRLSAINLSQLRQRLGRLSQAEIDFFDRFTGQTFHATHFTDARLDRPDKGRHTMAMYSREKLESRDVDFDREHTGWEDISMKADDNCVFFLLECGDSVKKHSSRFGGTLYRVPFDLPVFQQVAWGALDDLLCEHDTWMGQSRNKIAGLTQDEKQAMGDVFGHTGRDFEEDAEAFDDIFAGRDIVAGAALSILCKLRSVNEQLQREERPSDPRTGTPLHPTVARLLGSGTPEELNRLMTAFHTPEVRVPVHFFATDFEKFTRTNLGVIGEWNRLVDRWNDLDPAQQATMRELRQPRGGKPLPAEAPRLSSDDTEIEAFIDELTARPGEVRFVDPPARG